MTPEEPEGDGPYGLVDRFISKYREPWFIFFNIFLLWVAIFIVDHRHMEVLQLLVDYYNELRGPSLPMHLFNASVNFTGVR